MNTPSTPPAESFAAMPGSASLNLEPAVAPGESSGLAGVGGDSFVLMRCGWLREPLKSILLHHLAETSEDEATVRLLAFGNVELEVMDEESDPPYWHCSVTKKRGIPWVLGNGNGSTLRGALISTLTNFEADAIEAGGGGAEHGASPAEKGHNS